MATLQENIDTIQNTLDDIRTAIINKGGTVTGTDITTYASGIDNIPIPIVINREVVNGKYQKPATSFTFSLPSNATDLGQYAMYSAFQDCTGLTSVDLSSLTTISGDYAMNNAFYDCTGLTSVDLSSLTTISGSYVMRYTFQGCTKLTTLSFPSLISTGFGSNKNQFNNMLQNVSGCTVHFPSNLQSVIGSWSSVTSGFGGTNTTVLFDLPATS